MAQIRETPKGSIIQDGKTNIMWVKTKPRDVCIVLSQGWPNVNWSFH